ncbi:MAG: RNA methyltransferase [Thermoleophilaceae bacterium]|nr:RNA methyltransferase [Thermoleophilaceae bacterium]
MITSPDNPKLKLIRKLHEKKHRVRENLFLAEGEDLVEAARAAGWEPEELLVSGEDVEPELLDRVSALGSGTRVIGVYRQRWSEPGGNLSAYLHGVSDPGNVGTIIRTAHALADGPVIIGPGTADPWSPKAVRASMGSVFTKPPAQASLDALAGTTVALSAGSEPLAQVQLKPPVVVLLGAERTGLPEEVAKAADIRAGIPVHTESLNVAAAAAVALYELGRITGDA